MMKNVVAVIVICAASGFLAAKFIPRLDHFRPEPPFRALPALPLDRWMVSLTQPRLASRAATDLVLLRRQLHSAFTDQASIAEIYSRLLTTSDAWPLVDAKSLRDLAEELLAVRREVQQVAGLSNNEKYQRLTLLQTLIDETLVAGTTLFPGEISGLSTRFSPVSVKVAIPQTSIFNFQVFQGDVILSKHTGHGSSAFITQILKRPSGQSHSSIVYVEPRTDEFFLPEAWAEDGTKLRTFSDEFVPFNKARVLVYRPKVRDERDLKKYSASASRFVEVMKGRVGNVFTQTSFDYNSTFDSNHRPESKLSCTEVVSYAVALAGVDKDLDPYPRRFWNEVDRDFLETFSRVLDLTSETIPSPGDIELNPAYTLVAARVDSVRVRRDRREVAMIDAMMDLVNQNVAAIGPLVRRLDHIGNGRFTVGQFNFLKSAWFLPDSWKRAIQYDVPLHATYRQLFFFAYLNRFFTPRVRDELIESEMEFRMAHSRLPGINELHAMAEPFVRKELNHVLDMIRFSCAAVLAAMILALAVIFRAIVSVRL